MRVEGSTIYLTRGDTGYLFVEVEGEDGLPLALVTGDVIHFTVKRSVNDPDVLIQKVITAFEDGKANIKIDSGDTKPLRFATYKYDIQWTKVNGDVNTIIKPSDFVVESEVTNE